MAADPIAARTLLQLILPGLTARIGRAAGAGGSACRRMAGARDELVQEVVVAAWERIAVLAGHVADMAGVRAGRGGVAPSPPPAGEGPGLPEARLWPLEAAGEAAEPEWSRTTAEELTVCLIDAVRDGSAPAGQAGVVYTTRVLGVPPRALGRSLRTGRAGGAGAAGPGRAGLIA